MSSNRTPHEDHIVHLYGSPEKLRDALRKHAIDYMKYKEPGQRNYVRAGKERQRAQEAAKKTRPSVVEGDGFIMSDSRWTPYPSPNREMKDASVKKEGNGLKTAFSFVSFIRGWIFPGSKSPDQTESAEAQRKPRYEPRGLSKESRELLLLLKSRDFHDAVSCLAAHKKDGWYDAIGNDVVKAIDQAYATHDNDPMKALDAVAPMLAKLEAAPPPPPPPRKGPLL
ncbi:MAG: hypothetical protein AB7S78_14175 [Candidatus Omnitrophota bacterium]